MQEAALHHHTEIDRPSMALICLRDELTWSKAALANATPKSTGAASSSTGANKREGDTVSSPGAKLPKPSGVRTGTDCPGMR